MNLSKTFDTFSRRVTKAMGNHWAFLIALTAVVGWALSGPIFNFSQAWQMIINTGTTIITFLMVFVIQQAQNKDTIAMQIKLDEIIRSLADANNDLRSIEDKTEQELKELRENEPTNT